MKTRKVVATTVRSWCLIGGLAVTCGLHPVPAQGDDGTVLQKWKVPGLANSRKNPVETNEDSLAHGKELYGGECRRCHGSTGKGDGPRASELKVTPADLTSPRTQEQTDGALYWKISQGKEPMPSFRLRFTGHERWELVNYLRRLAPREGQIAQSKGPGSEPPLSSPHEASAAPQPGRKGASSGAVPIQVPPSVLRRPEYIHTLLNPLPIYGLAMGTLGLIGALMMKSRRAQLLALGLMFLAAASARPTYFTGLKAYQRVHATADGEGERWLDRHRNRAQRWIYLYDALAIIAIGAVLVPARAPKTSRAFALLTLAIGIGSLAAGGWIAKAGGRVQHAEFRDRGSLPQNTGGSQMPGDAGRIGRAAREGAGPSQRLVFADVLQPILTDRCSRCHGAEKQNHKLRLDSLERLLKGGESGPAVLAGKADQSEMIRRLLLPLQDKQHMPPKEEAQPSPGEIEVLRSWIDAGAREDLKVTDLKLTAEGKRLLERASPASR
jgi:mono/diheme cytochrome c family protein